jgi:structural maintenance of chromosome 1
MRYQAYSFVLNSKAQTNILAVDERQQLETLTRDEKTTNRTLAQLTEKRQGFEEKISTRNEDLNTQTGRRVEVMRYLRPMYSSCLIDVIDFGM